MSLIFVFAMGEMSDFAVYGVSSLRFIEFCIFVLLGTCLCISFRRLRILSIINPKVEVTFFGFTRD